MAAIRQFIFALLDEIRRNQNQISDRELELLRIIVPGSLLPRALEIVDAKGVERVQSSRAFAYRVYGSRPFPYRCSQWYCSCPAFAQTVVLNEAAEFCKHQLAALIADAAGKITSVIEVDDITFSQYAVNDIMPLALFGPKALMNPCP